MATLTECMSDHHQACDGLFAVAEAAALAEDWAVCQAAGRDFAAAVARHFEAEESLLFPACVAANGVARGPVSAMLGEHEMMRELLAELEGAAGAGDGVGFQAAADTLLILMQQHNLKEERILYPLCDQSIGGAAPLADQLQKRLENLAHV
jgi:iron-sulfur cluster repair protein YtfE (RIC family)